MAYQKTPLTIDMKNVVFVKPSNPIPSCILSLSDVDNRPDVNNLCPLVYVYRSENHDSLTNNIDIFSVIKEALSKALCYYYPLAGRQVKYADGKHRIHFNTDDGVPLVEAVANCHLSSLDYLDGNDIGISKHLAFDLPLQDQNGYPYLLVFKVTKFLCGGFTIGWAPSHVVVDGFGGAQFFKAVVELASGKNEPTVKPVWERERLVGTIPKQPFQHPMGVATTAAVSPFMPTTDFVDACFKVDPESIIRLKTSLMNESDDNADIKESFTTFESLAAYVWRSRARALNLNNDGKTVLIFLVGLRNKNLDPPFPDDDGYYGNAFVDAHVVLTVRELSERPLSEIVKVIRGINKIASTPDYIKKSLNIIRPTFEEFNIFGGAFTALTDWRHISFMENMDLGGNKLVNIVPPPCNNFGSDVLCIFSAPSTYLDPSMKGGVRIFTSLPSAAMVKFKEEMEALKTIG